MCIHACERACLLCFELKACMHIGCITDTVMHLCVCVCVCPLTVLVLSPAVSHESSHSVFSYPCLIRLTGEHCFGPAGRIFVTERCLAEKLHF